MRKADLACHYLQVLGSRLTNRNLCGPIIGYIEVTKRCSLRCQFCDLWRVKVGPHDEMTTRDLLELASDLAELGAKYVALFGGEAMLRRDLWEVMAYLKRRGVYVSLVTNGHLLPQFSRNVLESGIDMLAVSLDSADEAVHDSLRGMPGSWKRVVEGLTEIRRRPHRMKLVINTLVVKPNWRGLIDLMHLGMALGVRSFRFLAYNVGAPYDALGMQSLSLRPGGDEIDELRRYLNEVIAFAKQHRLTLNSHGFVRGIPEFYGMGAQPVDCFAGFVSVHVHADGRVAFCPVRDEAVLGNVRETPLREIWRSRGFATRRRDVMSKACDQCYISCYMEENTYFRLGDLVAKAFGRQ